MRKKRTTTQHPTIVRTIQTMNEKGKQHRFWTTNQKRNNYRNRMKHKRKTEEISYRILLLESTLFLLVPLEKNIAQYARFLNTNFTKICHNRGFTERTELNITARENDQRQKTNALYGRERDRWRKIYDDTTSHNS